MKRDVAYTLDTSLVSSAARTMRDRGVGFLPVCNEAGEAIGTITDRDVVVRVVASGRSPDATLVSDAMTPEIVSCSPEDELDVAESLMSSFQKSRVVCIDSRRRPLGVISLSDVADAEEGAHAGPVLTAVAAREARPRGDGGAARTCREVMREAVECVVEADDIVDAAERMRDRDVGMLPVCDGRGALVGVVTDRDLVVRVIAAGLGPEACVGDAMTRDAVTCAPDEPIEAAEDRMRDNRVSRIVCIDDAKRPIGVISLSDLAQVERTERASELLREVSERTEARAHA